MPQNATGTRRGADLVAFGRRPAAAESQSSFVRGQNFLIEWIDATTDSLPVEIASDIETIVITYDSGASIAGNGSVHKIPKRTLTVLPAGDWQMTPNAGSVCVLSTSRKNVTIEPLNAATYATPDTRVVSTGPAWKRANDSEEVQIFEIDKIAPPADNPRIKMFQSATMSINWVDYDGPRDRRELSPHSHRDFEQGSLAAAGTFIHHLRENWGKNANDWRDDEHLRAGSPSVLVIPPDIIHTSEGVEPGHHLLIDVFSPPRRDFIAKRWVHNSAEYIDPSAD